MDDPTDEPDPCDSTWSSLAYSHTDNNVYFSDRDHNNILPNEFPWNYDSAELESPRVSNLADVDAYQPSDTQAAAASTASCSSSQFPGDPMGCSDPHPAASNPSVSSSSSEDPTNKPAPQTSIKVKKKAQKRVKQPRFAFMTKSEVDHLEDGYRWRKYGQKAVKNSPFPRSYYRCTNTRCSVKKRVERSSEDPTVVITTYEGQHCHHTVGFPRSTGLISSHEGAYDHLGYFAPPHPRATTSSRLFYPLGIQINPQESSLVTVGQGSVSSSSNTTLQSHDQQEARGEERESTRVVPAAQQSTDHPNNSTSSCGEGLLGDIVPPGMRNP